MSFVAIPLSRSAPRTAVADLDALARASLLLFAITETDAKKRTESGVTVDVPTPVTVMCLEFSEALAGRAL